MQQSENSLDCVHSSNSPMVVCYVMTRDDFNQMMGNLKDALRGNLALQHAERVSTIGAKPTVTYKLEDLKILNILVGT